MGDIFVDDSGRRVQSVEEMAVRFYGELTGKIPVWRSQICAAPDSLEELEHEVRDAFGRGADLLVAGLLSVVMSDSAFVERSEAEAQETHRFPLRKGRSRKVRVRMLSGLLIWVSSLYCAPARGKDKREGEDRSGLYVELAQFGFGKGVTPGLESRVARQAGLCPSLELAQEELVRQGVDLDPKAVRRVANQVGTGFLRLRRDELERWREGELPAGDELKGGRVTVQIDGGRTKIRGPLRERDAGDSASDEANDDVGRSRKRPQRTCDAEWREPKLVTIFTHDENGRMVKNTIPLIDGTFEGPDAIAELIAMHLHRLGAAQAECVTFASDGAPWIWDRLAMIVALAKIQDLPVHEVLDNCHAAHHVSLALAAMGLNEKQRRPLYRQHRTLLRNGQWRRVVEELTELAEDRPTSQRDAALVEVAYLQKHGEAGRMSYSHFRKLGIPLGSGAIESTIRRVINQRLKGNSISWRHDSAEAMLQLRAQIISKRWDQRMSGLRQLRKVDASERWRWEPRPMRHEHLEGSTEMPA